MTTSVIDLAELTLYTPEQAVLIMSGFTAERVLLMTSDEIKDVSDTAVVSGYWLREQIRDGRWTYTKLGRRVMLSRPQIAAIIADLAVPATARRKPAA